MSLAKDTLPAPDLRGQLKSGLRLLLTGRVFLAWETGLLAAWWLTVILLDATTTLLLVHEGEGHEANPAAAALFGALSPEWGLLIGSLVCLLFLAFSVGDHREEDTYWLLVPPTFILCLKTWAAFYNLLLLTT